MLNRNIRQLWKNINQNKSIFFALLVLLILSKIMILNQVDWPKRYMLIAIGMIFLVTLLIEFDNLKKLPRHTFLLIFLVGTLNSLILPAGTGLDEQSHYSKAMQIADGRFINLVSKQDYYEVSPDSSFNPEGQVNKYNLYTPEWLQLKHQKSNYSIIHTKSYNIANPVFIPSAVGIKIGRLMSPNVYVSYYLGRIFNVLSFAIMAYVAVKNSKKYQLALFGVATLPFCLWIPAGYNYDSFYYGLTLLSISWLINMFDDNKKIQTKDVVWYTLFSSLLVLSKPPVVIIVCLPLFISKSSFISTKDKLLSMFSIIMGVLLSGLWLFQSTIFSFFGLHSTVIKDDGGRTISNVTYFSTHIVETIIIFFRTFLRLLGEGIINQIKVPNPHLSKPFLNSGHEIADNIVLLISVIVLFLVSFIITCKMPKYFKLILVGINVIIIVASIYGIAGDTRVYDQGDFLIGGVQGRYMFILLTLLPALLSAPIKKVILGDSDMIGPDPAQEAVIGTLVLKLCLFGSFLMSFTYIYITGYLLF